MPTDPTDACCLDDMKPLALKTYRFPCCEAVPGDGVLQQTIYDTVLDGEISMNKLVKIIGATLPLVQKQVDLWCSLGIMTVTETHSTRVAFAPGMALPSAPARGESPRWRVDRSISSHSDSGSDAYGSDPDLPLLRK